MDKGLAHRAGSEDDCCGPDRSRWISFSAGKVSDIDETGGKDISIYRQG